MKQIPILKITQVGFHWEWFQLFILGFYELERAGKIKLKFRCELIYRLSTIFPENYFIGGALRLINKKLSSRSPILKGEIIINGGCKKFCIDCSDSPFMFDSKCLNEVDLYFKMNCPKEINEEKGFRLTDDVWIPYVDHEQENPKEFRSPRKKLVNFAENIYKVKPLVGSFRFLSRCNSYQALMQGYNNYKKNLSNQPTHKLMCYFGNAMGPKPEVNVTKPDWNWEADIMGFYKEKLNHPNEKRAKAASLIASKGDNYDARVISEYNSDTHGVKRHEDLIVPLKDFCNHISHFEYNLNISGYRLSIPTRFLESFIVGTAILTDKLAVKWYLPFDEEVIETAEMGYLPDSKVDWDRVNNDIDKLPSVNKKRIIELYEKKWAPKQVAQYILKTVLDA